MMVQLSYTTFDGMAHRHELKPGTTRIGRTADNDLPIDELAVSARHCELRCSGGAIVVKDLDSAAGTYIDGEPVTESEIKVGQILGLGTFLVHLEASDAASLKTPPPLPNLAPAPLADGSYSCLRHQTTRASFECPNCFDLACDECVKFVEPTGQAKQVFCRNCATQCQPIDWSGLTMGKKEALLSLLPEPVQKALDFWAQRRGKAKS